MPAEYFTNPTKKFPVLYLQHGMGENEYEWSEWCQGCKVPGKTVRNTGKYKIIQS